MNEIEKKPTKKMNDFHEEVIQALTEVLVREALDFAIIVALNDGEMINE